MEVRAVWTVALAGVCLLAGCGGDDGPSRPAGAAAPRADALLERLHDDGAGDVMVVAHRACWTAGAPENSLAAIAECVRLGVNMIEIDVTLTADGVPVLMHDATVDRMTDGTGAVADLALNDLRRLRLREGGGGPGAALTDERPPTLAEAVALARGRLLVNLDAKGDAVIGSAFDVVAAAGVEREILIKTPARHDAPELAGATFLGRTLFMPIIRQCAPPGDGQPCSSSLSESAAAYAPLDPVAYEVSYVDGEFLRAGAAAIGDLGARVWVNTLEPRHAAGHTDARALDDPDGHWGRVVRDGASIIQTDYPERLLTYLRDGGLRED